MEVVLLSDSDNEDYGSDSKGCSDIQSVGATASVICEMPLNVSALQSKVPIYLESSKAATTRPRRNSSSSFSAVQQKNSTSHSFIKQTHLMSRKQSPVTSESGSSMSLFQRGSLNSYCYESYDPKAPPFESQQFNVKFRCCVGKCRLLLSNNVSFMFHLWAHLTEFSHDNGLNYSREMHRFSSCPQCLHSFPTPYRMQIHYNNVHGSAPSSSTCKVCEITVEKGKHWQIHGDFDAPFHCRKCRYRTSIRTNFIDHFVRFHSNTHTLLCPFCLCYYAVPKDTSLSPICERRYAKHFLEHQNEVYSCNQCSLKFLRLIDKIAHRKAHTQPNSKWISRNVIVHTRRKGRKLWSKKEKRVCLECGEEINNIYEHAKRIYYCAYCPYQTNCYAASQRHKFIKCRKMRQGMTRNRLLSSVVVCKRCKRASCLEPDILDHVIECSEGRCLVVDLKQENGNFSTRFRERLEVGMFALRSQEMIKDDNIVTPATVPVNPGRPRDGNTVSPSLVKAKMDLYNACLQSLRRIHSFPRFPFSDLLKSSFSPPA